MRQLAVQGGARKKPLSHRTLTYGLGALRQAFRYGKRQGWLTATDATDDAKAPGTTTTTTTATAVVKRWSVDHLNAFKSILATYSDGEALASEPWLVVGATLTLSGLRRSEVLGLDWEAVDMATGTVEIQASRVKTGRGSETVLGAPKTTNSHRVVQVEQIHPGFKKALAKLWLAQGRPESGLVVVDALGPVHPDRYSRRFAGMCDEAGVPRLARIHNVRHSLAIALQDRGVPDQQAASLLGHDVDTFRRFYLVTDDEGAAAAAKAAGAIFAVS